MSFRDTQLQDGETIIVETHPHAVVLAIPAAISIVALIGGLVLVATQENAWYALFPSPFALWLFAKWIMRASTEYVVTNYRVVKQTGVWTKNSIDAPLDKVNNIVHRQTLFQKLINNGSVGLETASELGMVGFADVPGPLDFKNAIVRERERYRSGLATTAPASGSLGALERLARLREEGHLTEEEFQSEKKKILEQRNRS